MKGIFPLSSNTIGWAEICLILRLACLNLCSVWKKSKVLVVENNVPSHKQRCYSTVIVTASCFSEWNTNKANQHPHLQFRKVIEWEHRTVFFSQLSSLASLAIFSSGISAQWGPFVPRVIQQPNLVASMYKIYLCAKIGQFSSSYFPKLQLNVLTFKLDFHASEQDWKEAIFHLFRSGSDSLGFRRRLVHAHAFAARTTGNVEESQFL